MKYDLKSRRMFLIGAGKTALAMPFLGSLLPREAWSAEAARPIRYVQIMNPFSPDTGQYFGSLATSTRVSPHVNYGMLSGQSNAQISQVVGPAFNSLRTQINLIRGLDVHAPNHNHNFCMATCASGQNPGVDNDEAPPLAGQESVDVLISKSSKVYASSVAQSRRLILMAPMNSDDYSNNRTFSWQMAGGKLQMIRPTKSTNALMDIFASGFGAKPASSTADLNLIQGVYDDYRSTSQSARISSADKQRLSAYMDLVSDIQKGLQSQASALTCNAPSQASETSASVVISNQFKILAAAMACDMTRVATVTLGMSEGYNTRHSEHHSVYMGPAGIMSDLTMCGNRVAEFLGILNGMSDGTGTLLDNSLVYWGMQYGLAKIEDQHAIDGFAVMLAGKAGGQMKTGHFMNYTHETVTVNSNGDIDPNKPYRNGIPLNNLLVTIMNCMGLGSSDYEAVAGKGYGNYVESYASSPTRPNAAQWLTTEGRRSPLPFLYTGPNRG